MTSERDKAKRWRPRYGLRSLLLWILVAGLLIGWLVERRRLSRENEFLRSEVKVERGLRRKTEVEFEVLSNHLNHVYSHVDEPTQRWMDENLRRTFRKFKEQ